MQTIFPQQVYIYDTVKCPQCKVYHVPISNNKLCLKCVKKKEHPKKPKKKYQIYT